MWIAARAQQAQTGAVPGPVGCVASWVEDGPGLGALQSPREGILGQVWSIVGCALWEAERLPRWELGSWATDILWRSSLWSSGFLTTEGPPAEDREPGLQAEEVGGVKAESLAWQQRCALMPTGPAALGPSTPHTFPHLLSAPWVLKRVESCGNFSTQLRRLSCSLVSVTAFPRLCHLRCGLGPVSQPL